ncbi:hypothetical protein A3Q56_07965 [Intoshia linei]|uniref:30S ribosomal protein S17 n=1 Tax=Intoshia linei TaxID=1819745 RepID=A0A177AQS3_9BILA|nr:hypothetical protein A3Q56_07965 [Intoshia linei]
MKSHMIGKIVSYHKIESAALIKSNIQVFSDFLKMHFDKPIRTWALLKDKEYKIGDYVLIKQLSKPHSLEIKYEVKNVIFEHGNVIDRLTEQKLYD